MKICVICQSIMMMDDDDDGFLAETPAGLSLALPNRRLAQKASPVPFAKDQWMKRPALFKETLTMTSRNRRAQSAMKNVKWNR